MATLRHLMIFLGSFALYDLNADGFISRDEMLKVIDAIYKMIGESEIDEPLSPEQRVDHLFSIMDKVRKVIGIEYLYLTIDPRITTGG